MHEINGENMDYLIGGGETTMILYNNFLGGLQMDKTLITAKSTSGRKSWFE